MHAKPTTIAVAAAALLLTGAIFEPGVRAELIADGDFSECANGAQLRRDDKGQDWRETRKDTDAGRALLKLSTRDIGGNATPKAMIKAHPELNTYLSQRLAMEQTHDFTVEYEVFVREILSDDNRSAFFFIGNSRNKKGGPNSTGSERFVFLGFENATTAGKINLFAREGQKPWEERTIVAENLDLEKWYKISVAVYGADGMYEVEVEGETGWVELEAFRNKGKYPRALTHVSFASWNDGAGTFYVDNVVAWED